MNEVTQQTGTAPATIKPEDIHLPPPSYWPIILAFGFAVIMAGLALSLAFVAVGVIIVLVATIGWAIEPIHPEEHH